MNAEIFRNISKGTFQKNTNGIIFDELDNFIWHHVQYYTISHHDNKHCSSNHLGHSKVFAKKALRSVKVSYF
jgi:hypothetical protein